MKVLERLGFLSFEDATKSSQIYNAINGKKKIILMEAQENDKKILHITEFMMIPDVCLCFHVNNCKTKNKSI